MARYRKIALWASALLVTGVALTGGSPATAASLTSPIDSASELAQKAQAADDRGYLVVSPWDGQKVGDATFYPTGPIRDDTLVVITDSSGALPNGLTTKALDALVAQKRAGQLSGNTTEITADSQASPGALRSAPVAAAATYYAWSSSSSGWSQGFQGGSLIGWNDSAQASYYFYTAAGYNQRASGNGLGYYRGYNGSQFGTWSKYYYVGIASSTGAGASVPWGNVAAVKKFRALCTQTTVCWGNFT